jgi:hypothetical protein
MENIIENCNTYYGTHYGDLKCMFVDPTNLQLDDGASDDEDCNQDPVDEVVGIVDIRGHTAVDEDYCFDNVDVPKGSSTPMDRTLTRLHETMAKIIAECIFVQYPINVLGSITHVSILSGVLHNPTRT